MVLNGVKCNTMKQIKVIPSLAGKHQTGELLGSYCVPQTPCRESRWAPDTWCNKY